jgi:hypothetical protein
MIWWYFGGVILLSIGIIAYNMYIAPEMDEETGRIIQPGKKISDLFKRK